MALKEAFISDFSLHPPRSRGSLFSNSLHFSYKRKKGLRNILPTSDSNMWQNHTIPKSEGPIQKLELIAVMKLTKLTNLQTYKIKNPKPNGPEKTTVNGNSPFHHIPKSQGLMTEKTSYPPAQAWPHYCPHYTPQSTGFPDPSVAHYFP